jgi:hypothetical protein
MKISDFYIQYKILFNFILFALLADYYYMMRCKIPQSLF